MFKHGKPHSVYHLQHSSHIQGERKHVRRTQDTRTYSPTMMSPRWFDAETFCTSRVAIRHITLNQSRESRLRGRTNGNAALLFICVGGKLRARIGY